MTREEAQSIVINLSEQLQALSELYENSEGEISRVGYSGLSSMFNNFADKLSSVMEYLEQRPDDPN